MIPEGRKLRPLFLLFSPMRYRHRLINHRNCSYVVDGSFLLSDFPSANSVKLVHSYVRQIEIHLLPTPVTLIAVYIIITSAEDVIIFLTRRLTTTADRMFLA